MTALSTRTNTLAGYPRVVRMLAARLQGELILPGQEAFDKGRRVWNGAYDRTPALIVRPANATDVRTAVIFGREQGLPLAVRSGGHDMAGRSTNDGGLVIDLSAMNSIAIDVERRTARIEPGLTWGEVAEAAHPHGLALTSGDMATVGVGGLMLGGGIGWMARKYGLTIDNLLAVDVVTADGQMLRASATEHPELFWGMRGGGGNFGIATAFQVALHPGGTVVGGAVIYPATDAATILRAFARYAGEAPDELTAMAYIMSAPPAPFIPPHLHGTPVVLVLAVYCGGIEEGLRVVGPLRALATPIADLIGPMPYPAIFNLTAEGGVKGRHQALRSMFLPSLGDEVFDTIAAQAAAMTSPSAMAQLRILGGAIGRVSPDATAFSHRTSAAMFTVMDSWDDPTATSANRAGIERFYQAMQPYGDGVYTNFLADEGEARIRAAYSAETYRRLVALKDRYDPANLFRLNQNIRPSLHTQIAARDEEEQVA